MVLGYVSYSVFNAVLYLLNFARVGGLQSQGAKGEAVVGYREPLATLNLKSSGMPEG
jgi:hypothetical protein